MHTIIVYLWTPPHNRNTLYKSMLAKRPHDTTFPAVRTPTLLRHLKRMKHIFYGSALSLVLLTANPAAAEVGGTITRSATGPDVAINNLVMKVLELFTWESDTQSITFADGRYTATAGCNNIFGSHEVNGTSIDFGTPASTLMYCEGKMDAESALNITLSSTTHMTFKDGALVLTHGTTSTSFAATLTEATTSAK